VIGYQAAQQTLVRPNALQLFRLAGHQLSAVLSAVIGYGTVKKRDLTGTVSVANADDMKKITATSVTQALQGQVPGLQVKATGAPGET